MTERPCPNCGIAVSTQASLCPRCGERLLAPNSSGEVAPPPGAGSFPGGPAQTGGYGAPPGFGPPSNGPERELLHGDLEAPQSFPGSGAPPGFGPPAGYGVPGAPFPPGFGPQATPPGMSPGFDPRVGMDPRQLPPGYGPPGGMYPQPPYGYPPVMTEPPKQKSTAGILAILLGSLGVHFFYLGQKTWGLVFLLGTLLSCGMGALITTPVSIIQGILYLCATDEDFHYKYVVQKRLF